MGLISYASDFVSFFLQKTKNREFIREIILFGSAAREEHHKNSDIDLFIDIIRNEKIIEKEVNKITLDFYNSIKCKGYWKLLGVKNEINAIVGEIDKWKLKDSMLGNAITLYKKYNPILEKGKNKAILCWDSVKPESKRVMLNKKIYGYTHYTKKYAGLLESFKGDKIGANALLIDIENIQPFIKAFKDLKVALKTRRLFEYEK